MYATDRRQTKASLNAPPPIKRSSQKQKHNYCELIYNKIIY